jgi:cation:H+ antiporter
MTFYVAHESFVYRGGLIGLYFGGEWLVKGASRTALSFALSPLIIGLTVVSIGTSAPELLVSVQAALNGSAGIALGNVIGSNIANIGLILGVTGLIKSIRVQDSLVTREIPLMLVVTVFASLLILDGTLSRLDGVLLLFMFVAMNGLFYYLARQDPSEVDLTIDEDHDGIPDAQEVKIPVELVRILFGIGALVLGANLLVSGASDIARSVGISELVIGLTMVAFGTSLPELAASVTAALKDEADIAIGNVIGSNIANLLLVLGATAFILPFDVGGELSVVEFVAMIGFSFMLLPFARNRELSRRESALFLGAYLAFVTYSFLVG